MLKRICQKWEDIRWQNTVSGSHNKLPRRHGIICKIGKRSEAIPRRAFTGASVTPSTFSRFRISRGPPPARGYLLSCKGGTSKYCVKGTWTIVAAKARLLRQTRGARTLSFNGQRLEACTQKLRLICRLLLKQLFEKVGNLVERKLFQNT